LPIEGPRCLITVKEFVCTLLGVVIIAPALAKLFLLLRSLIEGEGGTMAAGRGKVGEISRVAL
jgi:hypothetical protein